jgi:hypothetical protein
MTTKVPRTPVQSSNVAAVGYDPASSTLEVEFLNGGVYEYQDVPAEVAAGLVSAGSVGAYFAANVRHRYTGRKLS